MSGGGEEKKWEPADKPGSVENSHSSGTPVAGMPLATYPGPAWARHRTPIRSCSRRGLPCRRRCRLRGALLPHHFTLTPEGAVYFLWHFPSARAARELPGAFAQWSPDFPPRANAERLPDRLPGATIRDLRRGCKPGDFLAEVFFSDFSGEFSGFAGIFRSAIAAQAARPPIQPPIPARRACWTDRRRPPFAFCRPIRPRCHDRPKCE